MSDASDNDSSDSEPIEWNVTSRARRSTAGNRLSSLLTLEGVPSASAAAEDDDVQLLFKEDDEEPDEEFEEKDSDEDGAAVADDDDDDSSSSSSDEDDGGDDELEGEHQLQREERARKKQAKRKTEQAFVRPRASKPKRVKIAEPAAQDDADPTTTPDTPASADAPPKKRKKSERVSWLLNTDEHGPVRTSSRTLSLQNKERTQASLKESEAKRKRQMAVMEAASRRRAAERGAPMTQAERLAEAARVEELNALSLSRWEETERDRLEVQRARLEALQNRRLEGPFVRWSSGRAEWLDGKLVHVGRREKIEEVEDDEEVEEVEEADGDADGAAEATHGERPEEEKTAEPATDADEDVEMHDAKEFQEPEDAGMVDELHASNDADRVQLSAEDAVAGSAAIASKSQASADVDTKDVDASAATEKVASVDATADATDASDTKPLPTSSPSAAVDRTPSPIPIDDADAAGTEPKSDAAKVESQDAQPTPDAGATSSRGFLDGIDQYAAMHDDEKPAASPSQPASHQPDAATSDPQPPAPANEPPALPPPPPTLTLSSRQTVTLINFAPTAPSADLLRRVLLPASHTGSSSTSTTTLSRAARAAPAPLCAVTSLPARYRDPATGLAYRDSAALRRIRAVVGPAADVEGGEKRPRWSRVLGAWVGGERAAGGVPVGFDGDVDEGKGDVDKGQGVKAEEGVGEREAVQAA